MKMNKLVKFVLINNTTKIKSYYDYLQGVFSNLQTKGVVDDVEVLCTNDELEHEYIISLVDVGQVIERKWTVFAEFGTFPLGMQLELNICSEDFEATVDSNCLEVLKLMIKDVLKSDWKNIVWLYDKDAEVLSTDLYARFFCVENNLRKLINEVLFRTYGLGWWERFSYAGIKNKYKSRMKGYKTVVDGFKNIDDHLLSVDVGDLFKIITFKRYSWKPQNDPAIEEAMNDPTDGNEHRIVELLKKQLVLDTDLWTLHFSKYFDADFETAFHTFELNRNHVAHNKILDRAAYRSIYKSITVIEEYLKKANETLNQELLSAEKKAAIEAQRQIEEAEYGEFIREWKESDGDISIRTNDEIMEMFAEALNEAHGDIVDALRFREDIEISELLFDTTQYDGVLFYIVSKVSSERWDILYNVSVDDSEGASSTLLLIADWLDENETTGSKIIGSIEYCNGEAEYNEDQGYYMPITADGIDTSDIQRFVVSTIELIDKNVRNFKEEADLLRLVRLKDGGDSPIAEGLVCWNCMDECICVDESIAECGTCLNCGEHTDVATCERCGTIFEDEYYDKIKLCPNCKQYYEKG